VSLKDIFDVFSRRERSRERRKPIGSAFRTRVFLLCRDRFSGTGSEFRAGDYRNEFWLDMHRRFTYLLGRHRLHAGAPANNEIEDVVTFLSSCEDAQFLDFLEYIFQSDPYWRIVGDENEMVKEINQLLLLDDLPYALTPFIREVRTEAILGRQREVQALVSRPRVVMRDQDAMYKEAIAPAIGLLADRGYSSANQELLAALGDYRHGNHGDCLTKCAAAFESTLKILCARRGWQHQENDGAAQLLRVVIDNSTLDSYLEQPLLGPAMLRNRLGSAHGAGAQSRRVPAERARYAINTTAAAVLLVVEECDKTAGHSTG
jgi:hypothetical protein